MIRKITIFIYVFVWENESNFSTQANKDMDSHFDYKTILISQHKRLEIWVVFSTE